MKSKYFLFVLDTAISATQHRFNCCRWLTKTNESIYDIYICCIRCDGGVKMNKSVWCSGRKNLSGSPVACHPQCWRASRAATWSGVGSTTQGCFFDQASWLGTSMLEVFWALPEAADGARDKVWRGLQHIAPCSLFRQPMSIRRAAKGSHILQSGK